MVDSCHTAPYASGRPPLNYPCNLPFSVLISRQLGAHGSFPGLLAGSSVVGLHPAGLQDFVVAQPQDRSKSPEPATETSVVYWTGDSYLSETKGSAATPLLWTAGSKQHMAAIYATWEEGGYQL